MISLSLTFFAALLFFSAGITMLLFAYFGQNEKEDESIPAAVEKEEQETEISVSEYYIIKTDASGRVSVFLPSGGLYFESDIYAFALPKRDREALAVGIPVTSEEELSLYLEGLTP